MAPPLSIDYENRRITFHVGRMIPPTEARADYHRLLDLALNALASGVPLTEEESNEVQG